MFELDTHVHLVPHGHLLASFPDVEWDDVGRKLKVEGETIGLADLFFPEALIAWMDRFDIASAWVSPPPPLFRPGLDADAARTWAQALYDGLVAVTARWSDRLAVMRFLPVEHPEIAAELVAAHEGPALFAMSTGSAGLCLSDSRFEPLWRALDAKAGLVFLHPGHGCDPRLDPFYLHNLLGNPSETGVAVAHLVFSEIPERFPQLRFLLAHAGGTVPSLAGRWDRGVATARPGVAGLASMPGRQLRSPAFLCDCIGHAPHALAAARETFGKEAIVFGSDWPFPMGVTDPKAQLAGLDDEIRGEIAANSLRLRTGWKVG